MTTAETTVLPLTKLHQAALTQALTTLAHERGDGDSMVAILNQFADALPVVRSKLGAADRQRIDELDRNADLILTSFRAFLHTIRSVPTSVDAELDMTSYLLDAGMLQEVAEAFQHVAQAATEVALRIQQRVPMV